MGIKYFKLYKIYIVFVVLFCLYIYPDSAGAAQNSSKQIRPFNIIYGTVNGPHPLEAVADNENAKEAWKGVTPTRNFTEEEKSAIEVGVNYWAERMSKASPGVSANIFVGYSDSPAGTAFSLSPISVAGEEIADKVSPNDAVFDALQGGKPSPYPAGLADNIVIFNIPYDKRPQRALLDVFSTTSIMMHEMGHALGIMGWYDVDKNDKKHGNFAPSKFTKWNSHLYDVFGKQAKPGMNIAMDAEEGNKENVFQIYGENMADEYKYKYPTFHGNHVDALTDGKGMPVMGGFSNHGPGLDGFNALGHSGIMQSIMSYGMLQNMAFTELELAMFQDLGYEIDRELFFGKSYYYSVGGDTQTNTLGFGSVWFPNTSSFGVGVHIMRDSLNLTQAENIYANGYAGAGMRVDGIGNKLNLPAGITVSADGDMGTGVLVSYGRDNTLNLKGKVTALGSDGIGVMIAILAHSYYPYSSHMLKWQFSADNVQRRHEIFRLYDDLDGSLVQNLNLSGTLLASSDAIHIGEDAHVENINILNGAFIRGDIVSRWNPARFVLSDPESAYTTNLTFGLKADSEGSAIPNTSDESFSMRYRGDILGYENLDIFLAGGELNYAGVMQVNSFTMNDKTHLLTEFSDDVSMIEAKERVDMSPSSAIGFIPPAFTYGSKNALYSEPVLKFTESVPANPTFLPSNLLISIGAYDYPWELSWDDKTNSVMVNTNDVVFNDMRGGSDARNAQLALSIYTPWFDVLNSYMTKRFVKNPSLETNAGGMWITSTHDYIKHKGNRNYDVKGSSITFGLDGSPNELSYAGLAISLDYPKYDSDNAEVDGDSIAAIIYGGVLLPLDIELGFNSAYRKMNLTQTRVVYHDRYDSEYSLKTLSFGVNLGRRFELGREFGLRPFASWNYFYTKHPAYFERADIYALHYDDFSSKIHRFQAGLEGAWVNDSMSFSLKAYWSGLRGDTDKTSASYFVLDPNSNRFITPVEELDRDSFGLGINANFRLAKNTELSLEYSVLDGKNNTSQQGMMELRYRF
ncbi:MAG: autotransporter outer membrane beta-barrel domain-containing protein [Campylobacteraceae bacterium]|nr:autotransporter outer membrane beta-barrel domain-containing protein [Campylobacteraceae bacterium]